MFSLIVEIKATGLTARTYSRPLHFAYAWRDSMPHYSYMNTVFTLNIEKTITIYHYCPKVGTSPFYIVNVSKICWVSDKQ